MFRLRHDDREDGLVNERDDHPGIDTGPAGDDDHETEMAKAEKRKQALPFGRACGVTPRGFEPLFPG